MDQQALRTLTYGLYIVSSRKDDRFNGQVVNTVVQTTSKPITIAVSINRENLTHEFISASGVFSVSVLSEDAPLKLIGNFGFKCGRDIDKFASCDFRTGVTGAPIVLDNTLACLEARVIERVDLSTHTVFIGEVVEAEVLRKGTPMTYAYYHQVKGGKTPEKAATFIEDSKDKVKTAAFPRYICSVCGYIYDPAKGDPDNHIPPGTSFEDLPDDWTCPVCGASKDQFDRE